MIPMQRTAGAPGSRPLLALTWVPGWQGARTEDLGDLGVLGGENSLFDHGSDATYDVEKLYTCARVSHRTCGQSFLVFLF